MPPVRVLVVGVGNMGISHARAYQSIDGFEIAGLCSRDIASRPEIAAEFPGIPQFGDYADALAATKPDAVSINTWPDTHAAFARRALEANCHVFIEKPLAETVEEAEAIVALAKAKNRKLIIGYILRVHPSWVKFVEIGRTLGKPLVMRMNLNQQSSGREWATHKKLMETISPTRRLRRALRRRDVPGDGRATGARACARRALERRDRAVDVQLRLPAGRVR